MIFIVVTSALLMSSIIKRGEKLISFISCVTCVFLVTNSTIRTNTDYELYKDSYIFGLTNFESGYTYLARFFRNLNWSYEQFRALMAIATFLLMYIGVIRLTKYPAIVFFVYNVAVFPFDIIQVRVCTMLAISLFGFSIIANRKSVFSAVFGELIIFLAVTIHTLGVFFLVAGVFEIFKKRISARVFVIGAWITILVGLLSKLEGAAFVSKMFDLFMRVSGARASSGFDFASVYNNGVGLLTWFKCLGLFVLFAFPLLYTNGIKNFLERNNTLIAPILIGSISLVMITISADYTRLLRCTLIYGSVMLTQSGMYSRRTFFIPTVLLITAICCANLQFNKVYPIAKDELPYSINLWQNNRIK